MRKNYAAMSGVLESEQVLKLVLPKSVVSVAPLRHSPREDFLTPPEQARLLLRGVGHQPEEPKNHQKIRKKRSTGWG